MFDCGALQGVEVPEEELEALIELDLVDDFSPAEEETQGPDDGTPPPRTH